METFERMFIVPKGVSLEIESRPMLSDRKTYVVKFSFEGEDAEQELLSLRDRVASLIQAE